MDEAIKFDRTGVLQEPTYETFGCRVFQLSPATPDRLTPDIRFNREVDTNGELIAPDGRRIRFWSFVDPTSPDPAQRKAIYPSPMIRVRQGQIMHTHMKAQKGPHTIHHHGTNPTTFNDGVGHVSFEAGEYTYQIQPNQAGMNFYHCHRNTVLHFEMGLAGVLIVDPPEGPGRVFTNGPRYDVEKIWFADDMDPRWHNVIGEEHDAGLCGEDVGLNRFEPKYFFLSGVFSNRTMTDARAVVKAQLGQTILLRLLNASYSVLHVTLGVDALLVTVDGHSLADNPWEHTVPIPAGQTFLMATASRRGLIVKPTQRGTFPVTMEFRHWITGEIQDNGRGVVKTVITVV
jgi:FtsP/CotA-like multicopper oxidase with cupredoxin domain